MLWSGAVADCSVNGVQRLILDLGDRVAVQNSHGDVHVVTVRVQSAHVDCLGGHGDEDRDGAVLGLEQFCNYLLFTRGEPHCHLFRRGMCS